MTIEQYLKDKGFKVWEKGEMKRIYINDLEVIGAGEIPNSKQVLRGVTMYYDCISDKFVYQASSSREESVLELIAKIRKDAAEKDIIVEVKVEEEIKETVNKEESKSDEDIEWEKKTALEKETKSTIKTDIKKRRHANNIIKTVNDSVGLGYAFVDYNQDENDNYTFIVPSSLKEVLEKAIADNQ